MSRVLHRARVSEAEFLALPESHEHVELVDGEVILAPSPLPVHQILARRLVVLLSAWADSHPPAFVGLSPFDVRLGPERIVQPDLFVLLDGLPASTSPLDRAPDFVVEILSGKRSYDRLTKRVLYSDAGVSEYWIVDPDEASVEIVSGMKTVELARERIVSLVLPELTMDLIALFADLP